jgi:hypothetical protein
MADERELYQTKWWDARLLTPKEATLAFALAHFRAMAAHKASMGDRPFEAVIASRKLDLAAPEKWAHWEIMTKLRRFADAFGARYDDFWELAFEAHIDLKLPTRLTRKGTLFVPCNTFLTPSLMNQVAVRWQERYGRFVRYSEAPFFTPAGYRGLRLQDAYYDEIVARLMYGGGATPEKIRQMIDDGKLSADYLRKYVTNRLMTKGKAA